MKLDDIKESIANIGDSINSTSNDIEDESNSTNLFDVSCELEDLKDSLVKEILNLGKLMNELEEEELQGEDEDLRRNGGL